MKYIIVRVIKIIAAYMKIMLLIKQKDSSQAQLNVNDTLGEKSSLVIFRTILQRIEKTTRNFFDEKMDYNLHLVNL